MSDFYKPLTPSFRKDINAAIENQIRELENGCLPYWIRLVR